MNIASAKEQIKDTIEAYLKKDDAGMYVIDPVHQRPVFLLGAPGIGKTAIMEQIAQELGIGIVSYSMTHHTRQSALGLPRIEHHEFEGYEYDASEYTMSEIIAAIYEYMERTGLRTGVLFLDEINCVSETLYPSMLQFLQFKIFGKHRVPAGWVIVCAGNPNEYNRSVHEFDIVTLDRLREIDVEPDYAAWKTYAGTVGLHPAVTTFLEAKQDCFYKVESKPGGGKSFVTARGWEDLAQVITLYEDMGKPVNRDLFVQFLRDDAIADQFAVYYALFEKYRSDYQVNTILAGTAGKPIEDRAKKAEFDERIALLGLILDALSNNCAKVLDQEDVVLALRDVLRDAKSELLAGDTVESAVSRRVSDREHRLGRRVESGAVAKGAIRTEHLVVDLLKGFAAQCVLEKATEGEAAFAIIEKLYRNEVDKIQPLVDSTTAHMDNSFDFIDANFGVREMLVFMAELTTRQVTTRFIAHYGCDRYYEHNDRLQVDAARMGLADRVSKLTEMGEHLEAAKEESRLVPEASGLRLGTKPEGEANKVAEPNDGATVGKNSAKLGSGVSVRSAKEDRAVDEDALKEYYGGKQFEYGFSSVCKMLLPASLLRGKKVLDICCRRGRGVYKISSMVGAGGLAVGIDWSKSYIEEARLGSNRAARESGLRANNMEFYVAYPEDLIAAGIGTNTMDVVYVNNVMTLFYDQEQALCEIGRVLRPDGLLIMETIFADRPRNEEVIAQARALGNSIQAARTKDENYAWLAAAGFGEPSVEDEYAVVADRGYEADYKVEAAAGDDDVQYKAVSLYVHKR